MRVLWFFLAFFGFTLAKDKVHFQLKTPHGKPSPREVKTMLKNLNSALDELLEKDIKFDGSNQGKPVHISRNLDSEVDVVKEQLADIFTSILKYKNVEVKGENGDYDDDDEDDDYDDDFEEQEAEDYRNLFRFVQKVAQKNQISKVGVIRIFTRNQFPDRTPYEK
ncbi:uncharacterized protein LOC135084660 isoform X2 [Ostrinia nubilalis]|uniref:uncharacterized protein LOC135084660 isoform X2 n=1 Tax=Ostrinia nubilalis TaxID=29057 RepID=UPI0030826251